MYCKCRRHDTAEWVANARLSELPTSGESGVRVIRLRRNLLLSNNLQGALGAGVRRRCVPVDIFLQH